MTTILVCCAVLIAAVSGLYVLLVHEPFLAACWYRMFPGEDPYVPEAAEAPDPVDAHFTSANRAVYVKSNHPEDCAEKCCWEIRLNEMVERFDWHAYEHEMRKTK